MTKEIIILAAAWIISAILLLGYVPKNKVREALVIFFFKQTLTWVIGLVVVQYGLLEYPVRSFSHATKSSFDFEYFIYPSICVVFNLHYPEGKNLLRQFWHYFSFCTVMTLIEVLCERHTAIINYLHWEWYFTWITLFITFYVSRKFYVWFFRLRQQKEESALA